MRGYAQQPSGERSLWVIAAQVAVCPQECLLGSILGFTRIAQHSATQVVDRELVGLNQIAESRIIALSRSGEPFAFIDVHLIAPAPLALY
jgi:hypothetical protein